MTTSDSAAAGGFAGLDMAGWATAQQRGLEAMAGAMRAGLEAQMRMMDRAAAAGADILGFVERRLERDRLALETLSACRSPEAARETCARFLGDAMRDYAEEMGALAGVFASGLQAAAVETAAEAQEAARAPRSGPRPAPPAEAA